MKFAVIVFPGSNCDVDMYHALTDIMGCPTEYVSHNQTSLEGFDAVLLPGGFSYGDYLRSGAMSALSNIIPAVVKAAEDGKAILGVCNGFQILTEIGLLPGVLIKNAGMKFVCAKSKLRIENNSTRFTNLYGVGEEVEISIAHNSGNYYVDEVTHAKLRSEKRIVFTYLDNPNGSVGNIAGVVNEKGNVLGMMPHPERSVEKLIGGVDGIRLFKSILAGPDYS